MALKAVLFDVGDLYPDARACLVELHGLGYVVGVAGNQGVGLERDLRGFGLEVDLVASSASLGARKPAPEFFERLVGATRLAPGECAYVGDRVDFDVRPAAAAGTRRGARPARSVGPPAAGSEEADLCVESLAELPAALRSLA